MMALEAVKLLTGAGDALTGGASDLRRPVAETRTVRVGADPECPVCGASTGSLTSSMG